MKYLRHLQYVNGKLVIFTQDNKVGLRPCLKVSDRVLLDSILWAHNGIVMKNHTLLEIRSGNLISPRSLNSLLFKKKVSNEKRPFIKTTKK